MSVKDPFQALVDEITLVRNDVERLQRTSLDRKEAEKLNAVVAQGLDRMAQVGPALQQRIEQSLATAALDLRQGSHPRGAARKHQGRRRPPQGRRRGSERGLEVVWRVLGLVGLCGCHRGGSGPSGRLLDRRKR